MLWQIHSATFNRINLVPTRGVGMPLHRAAVQDAARLHCIPTQARGNENSLSDIHGLFGAPVWQTVNALTGVQHGVLQGGL